MSSSAYFIGVTAKGLSLRRLSSRVLLHNFSVCPAYLPYDESVEFTRVDGQRFRHEAADLTNADPEITMFPFNKLPNSSKTPPGLERKILRHMPAAFLGTLVLCGIPSLCVRLADIQGSQIAIDALIHRVDIMALAVLMVVWNIAFAITTGAVLIVLMKGPGYVADGYKLIDADSPEKLVEKPWVADRK